MDEMELQFRRAAYDAECFKLIDAYGFMVQGVFPTEDSPPEKRFDFCYTVGLAGKELPEFVEYGLSLEIGKVVLNQLAKAAIDGEHFQPGVLIEFQNSFYGTLLEATDLSDLTMARRFYGNVRALQLVFQDTKHRWPDDPGYESQGLPLLGKFPDHFIERK